MQKGYVHLYTGDGKGKTTAALGLALRACSYGKSVLFAQFIKGMAYSELKAQEFVPNLEFIQYGRDCFIERDPTKEDVKLAQDGLHDVFQKMKSQKYDILVLDEITIALYYNLFTLNEVIDVIKEKPAEMELILTGRAAPKELYDYCDLITEMKEIKHYYTKGVLSRWGVDK